MSLELSYHFEIKRCLSSGAADAPVKFQSNTMFRTTNLAASKLHKIW